MDQPQEQHQHQQQVATYDPAIQQFKTYVNAWMELDDIIRKLTATLKEKRELKDKVSNRITDFMTRHSVEDVNLNQNKLRLKVVRTKAPLSQRDIKQRLMENLPEAQQAQVESAFSTRTFVERPSLRRIRVKPASLSV